VKSLEKFVHEEFFINATALDGRTLRFKDVCLHKWCNANGALLRTIVGVLHECARTWGQELHEYQQRTFARTGAYSPDMTIDYPFARILGRHYPTHQFMYDVERWNDSGTN
jgi:hypothetical protein